MLRKFCRLTLDRSSAWVSNPGSTRTSSLANFPDLEPEPGMLYVTTRAISSRVNANYDGWPAEELRKGYRTFIGRGVFVDHNNWDTSRSRGVILDAKLHEDKLASGHEDVWVELLIEVDASAFPKLAEAIMEGDIDSVSMGADVEYTICSVCGNKAREVREYCGHIPQMKGRKIAVEDGKLGSIQKLCWEDCYGVNFFEISFVFEPADESALISDRMLYSGQRVASRRTQRHLRLASEGVRAYRHRVSAMSKVASRQGEITADKVLMNLPEPVNTLREEQMCPRCGLPYNGISCKSCGFEQAAPGLGDPNTGVGEQSETNETDQKPPSKSDDSKPKTDSKPPAKDDDSKKKPPATKQKGGNMSRFEELAGARTAGPAGPFDQSTAPGTNVPGYGEGAGPEGQTTAPPEPPVDPASQLRAEQDQVDPRTLDVSEVQGPPGQSEVSQTGQQVQLPKQVQTPTARREAVLEQARRHVQAAEYLARVAENIEQTDVQQLDQQPPGVDFGPDGQLDVLAPTDESQQLQRADRVDVVNDGSETGVQPSENQQTVNPFQDDVGSQPYMGSAKREAADHRVLRIANFVDERVELGLTPKDQKMAEVARFAKLTDNEIDGWVKATEEFKQAQIRIASRRTRVASRGHRLPELGEEKVASAGGDEPNDDTQTYLAFMS